MTWGCVILCFLCRWSFVSHSLAYHCLFSLPPPDTPSSPSIDRVEPYSSTAQVEFDEPEATGGVPILKYKAEWRALGEGEWHSRLYDAKEGRMIKQDVASPTCISEYFLSFKGKPQWHVP